MRVHPTRWMIAGLMLAALLLAPVPMFAFQTEPQAAKPTDDEAKTSVPAKAAANPVEQKVAAAPAEYLPEPTRVEVIIESVLNKLTEMNFIDTPLNSVAEFLKEQQGINIRLDAPALEEAGIALNTPVTLQLSGIRLRSCLKLILEPLKLTYVIEDEVLKITTAASLAKKTITRTFPVGDLCPQRGDYDNLRGAIVKTVSPDSWAELGGMNSIVAIESSGCLVVRANLSDQSAVLDLLRNLRAAARLPIAPPDASRQSPTK